MKNSESVPLIDKDIYTEERWGEINKLNNDKPSKLSTSTILGYSAGGVVVFVCPLINSFFLNPFLLEVAGIDPFLAGFLLMFQNILDAFTDPLIGYLSDRTPWGPRRIPWIAAGALPFCYFYFLSWLVPSIFEKYLVVYYAIVIMIRTTALTSINIPFNSLSAELTHSYDQRSILVASRWVFALTFGTISIVIQSVFTEYFKDENNIVDYEKGYAAAGAFFGIAFLIPMIIFLLFVREPVTSLSGLIKANTLSLKKNLISAFKNVPFLSLLSMFIFCWIALNFLTSNLFLYVKYVVHKEQNYTVILFLIMVSASLALVAWAYLSIKIGKKTVFIIGSTQMIIAILLAGMCTENTPLYLMYIILVIGGIGLSVCYLIPYSMLPDVIEYDELYISGERREGLFFSLYVFFEKLGLAISLSLGNFVLGIAGYVSPDDQTVEEQESDYQSQSVLWTLRLFISVVPSILMVLSMLSLYFYPITKKKHAEIVEQLRNKSQK